LININFTDIKAVILAGGRSKRLGGGAKALRQANGRPLLGYVLDALGFLPRENIIIVVGYERERVIETFPGFSYAVQEEQLGTGHAALCAEGSLAGFNGSVLVCCCDMPLVKQESYRELIELHKSKKNDCTLLSSESDTPQSFGRVVRSPGGDFLKITETRDCTPEELLITELNSGVYVFSAERLFPALRSLSRENAQGEYYLTDAPGLIKNAGGRVGIYKKELREEILGVNTPEQLAQAERILAARRDKFNPA
jgi:bifunctional UDP-N-acetylglucosamine pyrophosphorylase/glucosamine-1-phosphate N-acetyltransferase/UDP-N-acetylglucosamine pyrophosphorylase